MKKIDNQLDDIWSLAVKKRAKNKCEKCGKTRYLNSHHIFSRQNKSVRWDMDNGVCLCAGCHALNKDSAHKAPIFFIEWLQRKKGEKWYMRLKLKANNISKLHDFEKGILLQELKKLC